MSWALPPALLYLPHPHFHPDPGSPDSHFPLLYVSPLPSLSPLVSTPRQPPHILPSLTLHHSPSHWVESSWSSRGPRSEWQQGLPAPNLFFALVYILSGFLGDSPVRLFIHSSIHPLTIQWAPFSNQPLFHAGNTHMPLFLLSCLLGRASPGRDG